MLLLILPLAYHLNTTTNLLPPVPYEAEAAHAHDRAETRHAAALPSQITPTHPTVCDEPEFAADAPRPKIKIIAFAWRRLSSLQRLLKSLASAHYCGHQVTLEIHVDGQALQEVLTYARSFYWSYGPFHLRNYDAMGLSLGIRKMWINATGPKIEDDEHIVPLEDDIQVSPYFYWWILRANAKYGPFGDAAAMRKQRLVGLSLYTPRLDEIHYPQRRWLPHTHTKTVAFLLQVPCSWGSLFIGSQWRDFLAFYERRVEPPFFDFSQEARQRGIGVHREQLGDPRVMVPASRSNVWPRSWKRFMIDFMYGRGLVMLYPSLTKQRAFSTTYMERGGHTAKDGRGEREQVMQLRRDIDPLKTVPLVSDENFAAVQGKLSLQMLPSYQQLPVFDLYHTLQSREVLAHRGFAFIESVRWWGRQRAEETSDVAMSPLYWRLADSWSSIPMAGRLMGCAVDELPPILPVAAQDASLDYGEDQKEEGGAVVLTDEQRSQAARYLVYQPPGGLGEWVAALRHAIGVARALSRILVVPPILWEGDLRKPLNYSDVFDLDGLNRTSQSFIEWHRFKRLGIEPTTIVLLHTREPDLVASRDFFDAAGWDLVPVVHMVAQNVRADDYRRLYGGCSAQVIAFSHMYGSFDDSTHVAENVGAVGRSVGGSPGGVTGGGPAGATSAGADDATLYARPQAGVAMVKPEVRRYATEIATRLRSETGRYTCVHLANLDEAVLSSHAPRAVSRDVAEPAARPVGSSWPGDHQSGPPTGRCDMYGAEARHASGRSWVKELVSQGAACRLNDAVLRGNLLRLPPKDPILLVPDGATVIESSVSEEVTEKLGTSLRTVTDVGVGLEDVPAARRMSMEVSACAMADTLLLNGFSPLSALIKRTRNEMKVEAAGGDVAAAAAAVEAAESTDLLWASLDKDVCVPLIDFIARFDIQSNRYGVLGQFGPLRKLQLSTVDVSSIVGPDGRIMRNGSIEMDVFVSSEQHALAMFVYTKLNNVQGIIVPVPAPPGGWEANKWQHISMPITERMYSKPRSTPWDSMDRLELYYTNPYHTTKGDFVRLRHVYIRSSAGGSQDVATTCLEIMESSPTVVTEPTGDFRGFLNPTDLARLAAGDDSYDERLGEETPPSGVTTFVLLLLVAAAVVLMVLHSRTYLLVQSEIRSFQNREFAGKVVSLVIM